MHGDAFHVVAPHVTAEMRVLGSASRSSCAVPPAARGPRLRELLCCATRSSRAAPPAAPALHLPQPSGSAARSTPDGARRVGGTDAADRSNRCSHHGRSATTRTPAAACPSPPATPTWSAGCSARWAPGGRASASTAGRGSRRSSGWWVPRPPDGNPVLTVRTLGGRTERLTADRVVATGYRADVTATDYLGHGLRTRLAVSRGTPRLGPGCVSSCHACTSRASGGVLVRAGDALRVRYGVRLPPSGEAPGRADG